VLLAGKMKAESTMRGLDLVTGRSSVVTTTAPNAKVWHTNLKLAVY